MKKQAVIFTLLFIIVFNSFSLFTVTATSFSEMKADYEEMKAIVEEKMESTEKEISYPASLPSAKGEVEVVEGTKHIIVVYEKLTEDDMLSIARYNAADEEAEIWLYPLRGDIKNLKVEANDECTAKLFGDYLGNTTQTYKEADILTNAVDKLNSSNAAQKILCAKFNVNIDGEPERNKYSYDFLDELRMSNPAIQYLYATDYNPGDDLSWDEVFNIEKLGYEYSGDRYYYREEGKVVIEKGKADKNILVIVNSSKAELLHIGGFLATSENYEKYLDKSRIKNAAIAYNKINISRTVKPKNIAIALFTITDDVGSTASDEFTFMVKNAEDIDIYTKTVPCGGTSGTYNKSADDKIENLYAPEESTDESTGSFSIDVGGFEKEETGFFGWVKKAFSVILAIIGSIIRLALLIFVGLLIFHKKFRGNFLAWIFSSKYGPKIQGIYEKIVDFVSQFFATRKKLKGNASLQGKFVFISHASVDLKKQGSPVAALIAELESMGVPCWTSENGIEGGEDYNEILPIAIKKCHMMLFFISPVSISSEEVESEIIAAKREKKKLIPIQIVDFDLFASDKWQHLLSQRQVTPLYTANPEDVKKLAEKIKKVYDDNK